MTPRCLLGVTDVSSRGDHALARAGHLCPEHRASLKLLSAAYPGEPPPLDAACRLPDRALQPQQRHGIRVRALNPMAFSNDDVLAAARSADLLVWGTARARGVRAFLLGQPVEAVIRQCRRPVLVVRRPADAA